MSIQKILIIIVRAYRYGLSPLMGHQCRFHPSCSCYTEDALKKYGVMHGSWLGLRRILKCHPWHPGGVDFLPEEGKK